MIRNYIKVTLRTVTKQKLFSLINASGLTIGIAASLFVALYIIDELSYDRFHSDIDRMYRISLEGRLAGQEVVTSNSSPPIGAALVAELPEIDASIRIQDLQNILVSTQSESFVEERGIIRTDSNFFNFFDFKLIEGNKQTVLTEPNTAVLTEKAAAKYFGTESPIGKQLMFFNSKAVYKITGIAENPPSNSHFHFDIILTTTGVEQFQSTSWLNNSFQTYIKGVFPLDLDVINLKIAGITKKNVGPEIEQYMGKTFDEFIRQGNKYGYFLTPVSDLHLNSPTEDELEAGGDIKYVYLFTAIGIFIILIACINFMNLATAKSAGRSKEVGLRKTFGSQRGQLISQFMVESLFFSIGAGILAVLIVIALLPFFNNLTGKLIAYSTLYTPSILGLVLAITVVVGILSGSYPALYLTSFRPAEVLKGKVKTGAKSGRLRGILVVAQFGISIILIVCTLIVFQQLNYTQNKNLGFDRQNVIVVQNTARLDDNRDVFKDKLMNQAGIGSASYTNSVIPGVNNTTVFSAPGSDINHIMGTYLADYEHVTTLKLSILQGRNFSRDFPSDSLAILVNEAVVAEMGWEDPVGQKLVYFDDEQIIYTVVGVMKDFNFESLHLNVRPLVLRLLNQANRMVVRYEDGVPANEAVATIEATWKDLAPNELFQYNFLDESFDALYRSEQRLGKIFYIFTGIAIFIACLGLFGLAAFIAEQRTKEVGIRKALGASEAGITMLLSREFVKYILISLIIAIYPAYAIMHNWLEGFAYRITISPLVFVLSGIIAVAIALITVSYQAIRAAKVNPVESLKYE